MGTLAAVFVLLAIWSPTTDAGFSMLLQNLHSSLKESLSLLESLNDETYVEADLLSGLGRPSSCAEHLLCGETKSGVYTIYPRQWYKAPPFQVYCDMETDGGGWTVFQRRDDYGEPRQNFFNLWSEFKKGFGNMTQEFWLGNDHLYLLTNQDHVTLRIDMADFDGSQRYAVYDEFQIASKDDDYRLRIGKYSGDAGDSMAYQNGHVFTTRDKDGPINCGRDYKGGWWYGIKGCHHSNLNGLYLKGAHTSFADGINWFHWKGHNYSLKKSEMKVRPTNFLLCQEIQNVDITPS